MRLMICFILVILCQISGFGKPVKLMPKGGVFEQSVYVKMETDSNTSIFYTINGSVPSYESLRYVDSILVTGVTVLRAVTYIKGNRSKINTQSYFTERTYTLPIISITSDPENFWSYGKGIYEKGCCADSTMPYYGANFWKSWEYQCNVEMYTPKGKKCFNQLAGMSLFGGYSRMLPQKSLAIIARSKYGKNRFKYPIFKERNIKKYKSFIIRNSGGDFKRTQLRDAFMTQLAKPTGIAIQAYEPAIVYLNGKYWGIQNLREKISEHYLEGNFDIDKNNVDILRHNAVKRHGFSKSYKLLKAFLKGNDLSDNKIMDSLSKFMNIHDYISYNISEVYSDNKDAGGNIRYFKERKPNSKWRWIFYDLDMGLSNDDRNGYASNTLQKFTTSSTEKWPNPSWSTFIIRTLLKNKKLEDQYITTFCDYLNTCFHQDTATALLDIMTNRIEHEIPYHQKRWGSTVDSWHKNIDVVREFVQKRPEYLFKHLDQKFGLDTLIEITIEVPDSNVCRIMLNNIDIKENFKGLYFTNIPQIIKVIPKHDFQLSGWAGRKEVTDSIVFTPTENMHFEPTIVHKDSSKYRHMIILNEVNFGQVEYDSVGDWIELHNSSNHKVNISGWVITDKSFSKGFKIENGLIEANSYVVLAEKKDLFMEALNSNADQTIGNIGFGLSRKGEFLKLYDAKGLLVDYFQYDTSFIDIDTAFSLALTVPDSNHNDIDQWLVQSLSPLNDNPSYSEAKEKKLATDKQKKLTRLIIALVGCCLLVGLSFLIVRRRRKARLV